MKVREHYIYIAILVFCLVQEQILYEMCLIQDRPQQDYGISVSFNMLDRVITLTDHDIAHVAAFAIIAGLFIIAQLVLPTVLQPATQ